MNLKQMGTVYNINKRMEEAEARKVTTVCRLADLMNRRCRNEAARLHFINRCQDDLRDSFIEIKAIRAKLEAVTA